MSGPLTRRIRPRLATLAPLATLALCACGDNSYRDEAYYSWNDATALGAFSLDGIKPDAAGIRREVMFAREAKVVAMFYGHNPPIGTSYETIDALLTAADELDVPVYTFADLAGSEHRGPGICLSFDDTEVDAWFALRPLLGKHGAHVTFFVTEYADFTDQGRQKLHQLYAEGDSIEAHGIHHLFYDDYTGGEASYIATEVQPSIDILRADGFAPVAFAYPGGTHTESLDHALASHIRFVRTISGHLKSP
jgi:peptidoglycan/xylan/chitin deacetylase (PgdA/CDA1 family)